MTYREGQDNTLTKEQKQIEEVPTASEIAEKKLKDMETDTENLKSPQNEDSDPIETGILLVRHKSGQPSIIREIGIPMERQATNYDVYMLLTEAHEYGLITRVATTLEQRLMPLIQETIKKTVQVLLANPRPGFRSPKKHKK